MDVNVKIGLLPSEALRQILQIENDLKHQPYDKKYNRHRLDLAYLEFDNSIERTLLNIIKGDTYDSSKS